MYKELVSVIMPIYNAEEYLSRCLDSLVNQSYSNMEIILINDGSIDNCHLICEKYAEKDKRIKVIHKENGGASSARNIGLDNMHGEFITFVDSDDFLHKEFIEKLYNLCVKNDCQISQCSFEEGLEKKFSITNEKIIEKKYDHVEIFNDRAFKITPWGKLYKSSLLSNVRFPVGVIHEDEFTTYKVVYNAHNIILTNEKLYYYYQAPNSVMRNNNKHIRLDFIEAYEERIEFFKQEKKLKEISIKEYCIRLMFYYMKSKKNNKFSNISENLLKKYNENYQKIENWNFFSYKERAILHTFTKNPALSTFLVNKIIRRNL